ncbi:MAG TPA: pentapeptide repeat-containing protein [Pyrinomonadaceae bacterium]|nr:pentapeptide repeat-containing protein [Pyrinomonadaceae bacterium]
MADAFSYQGLIIEVDPSVPRISIDGCPVPKEQFENLFVHSQLPGVDIQTLSELGRNIIDASPEFKQREAARLAHVAILRQGAAAWNQWRKENPEVRPLLYGEDLSRETFGVNLSGINFANANLIDAKLIGVNLEGANFHEANLKGAFLNDTDLKDANFCRADLYETDLSDAKLIGANLQGAQLAKTILRRATISACKVYGMSAWDLKLEGAEQRDLIVRYRHQDKNQPAQESNEDEITVDDLRVAQFVYLLLNNQNIRDAINTITLKTVLILGAFSEERKEILDALRDELRAHELVPILFDFEKPQSRNRIETVSTLAHMARFIIADLTDPRSTPAELHEIVPRLPSVPVQAIILDSQEAYALFQDLREDRSWVLKPYRYTTREDLLQSLSSIIANVEMKAGEIAERRRLMTEEMKR